jgi:hypothetical protein
MSLIKRRDFIQQMSSGVVLAAAPLPGQAQHVTIRNPHSSDVLMRHYLRPEHLTEDFNYLLQFCQFTGCRKLLLFTSSYEFAPSLIPPEELAGYMNRLKPLKGTAAAAGISIYINVLQTLGHVYLPEDVQRQFGVQRRVDINGVPGQGGCPLDPAMRDYLKKIYRLYAEFGTELMFVDDDYRYLMGAVYCFCPLHLSEVGKRLGRSITLEDARASVESKEFGSNEIKRVYWNVMNDAMVSLAREIEAVVHGIDPKCKLGWMTAYMPYGSFGEDAREVAAAFAGGKHRPFVRPQCAMYSELSSKEIGSALLMHSIARDMLGNNLDYYPEIENYHYSLFSKSAHMTFLQMLTQYFLGFRNLALNFYFTCDICPADARQDPFAVMLKDSEQTFDTVRRAIGPNPTIEGVRIVDDLQRAWLSRSLDTAHPALYRVLLNCGIPTGFERQAAFQILTGDAVLAKSDVELDDVLSRGAVMDASALECLHHRGRTSRIGVEPREIVSRDDIGSESFLDVEFSPVFHDKFYPLHLGSLPGDIISLRVSAPGARVISEVVNYRKDRVTPAVVLTELDDGTRFAVLAHAHPDFRAFECPHREEQLTRVLEWVGRRPLPIKVVNMPFVVPYLVRAATGKRFLLLINFSSDTYNEIYLTGAVLKQVRPSDISELAPQRTSGTTLIARRAAGDLFLIQRRLPPDDYVILSL